MRRSLLAITTLAAFVLAGCSAEESPSGSEPQAMTETAAPPSSGSADSKAKAPPKLDVSVPQLSYAYALSYLLPSGRIAEAQNVHRARCEAMGPQRCQLLAFERGTDAARASDGALLKMRVVSAEAASFQNALDQSVAEIGGRVEDAKIAAEDVSKTIVDTEARIRQRELLVARLTQVLRTRTGKVSELMEAERSVAQAQEELDQARGWLATLRSRVAMSEIEVRYNAIAPAAGSAGTQLSEAAQGSGATFLIGLNALLTLAIYLAPWMLLILPAALLARWLRRLNKVARS